MGEFSPYGLGCHHLSRFFECSTGRLAHICDLQIFKHYQCVVFNDVKSIFEKIANEHQVILKEFNGEEDHVYMLIHYPPKVSLAKLVNSLKGVSWRRLRQNWPELEKNTIRACCGHRAILLAHVAERRLKSFANTLKRRRHQLKALEEDTPIIPSMNEGTLRR